MGLPGAEKTTMARVIAPRSDAVVFNVDEVHANISRDLGFSLAVCMGWLCDRVVEAGCVAPADFGDRINVSSLDSEYYRPQIARCTSSTRPIVRRWLV
jgi:hypothetical protein